MMSIEAIINDVCSILGNSPKTAGITFLPEFPSVKQDLPLKHPVVSVGVDGINIIPTDTALRLEENASSCTVDLKLLICVPKTDSGNSCHRVLDKVISACPLLLEKYVIKKFNSGTIKYSTVISGLVLPLNITFSVNNVF